MTGPGPTPTHAVGASLDQTAAKARDIADTAIDAAGVLDADISRTVAVSAVAVALLERHGCCVLHALWAAAELAVRAVERGAQVVAPPALADIRLAADFPGYGDDLRPPGGKQL